MTIKDVIDFLLNAYFGNVDDPVFTAANAAYLDLNRTIEFKKAESVSDGRKIELRREAVSSIKTAMDVLNNKENYNQANFDEWHIDICRKILQIYSKAGVKFHYGQAQKWVNMTLKYLSVIIMESTKDFFAFMHVPIDSNVIEIASEEFYLQGPGIRWSRMNEAQYMSYQMQLRSAIESNTNYCPMLWEFRNWER